MSTNTTSTSERVAADTRAVTPSQESGARGYDSLSAAMAALPDPAVIARLANEFFAALPGKPAPPDAAFTSAAPSGADTRALPETPPTAGIPDYPRELFSFPSVPGAQPFQAVPNAPASAPAGPLSEADFRAIAASLAGAGGAGQFPAATPPPATGPSSSYLDAEKGGPWAAAPVFPPAIEMYSFPGVPAMPSSPPTNPPGGADAASVPAAPAGVPSGAPGSQAPQTAPDARTDPWAAAPAFPVTSELYSLPRVPGVSIPGSPEPVPSQPSLPAAQGVVNAAPIVAANAAPPAEAPTVTPPALPGISGHAADAENIAPTAVARTFPSVQEMFSFPGVPGAQSPPGVPVMPSSVPTKLPEEKDLQALPASVAGASTLGAQYPGVPQLAVPGTSAKPAEQESESKGTALPAEVGSMEFRPDVVPDIGVAKRPLDPRLIRRDFPILQERVHGRQLIWLDNAATTQKPNAVIDRLSAFYRHENSNIHRAAHTLAARATDAYESAREKTRRFLNAPSTREVIFVRGTTEGINLVAQSWGRRNVNKDDEIVITWLEHHANIVPWQQLCSEKGARLRVAPVNDRGEVILEQYEKLLGPRTRLVAFSHVSNALGTVTPAHEMVQMAHRHGALVLVDGAQSVSHMRTDVQSLDCDFYVFSGHKIFGPTGIGVVYGKLDPSRTCRRGKVAAT